MKILSVLLSLGLCLTILSCKEDKAEQLIGQWQEVAIINPQLDEAIQKEQAFADTLGTSTDSVQNQMLYGTGNIDSMRTALKARLDSFRKAQSDVVNATRFDFRKNGLLYIHSRRGLDSSSWYLDGDGALILDKAKLKGSGNKRRTEILHLSDTLLKLQFADEYLTSTATFKPVKE